ncbi:MBL fold metallo-hydrolase [Bradyrhizobium ottawaense]|uniref:MBL fold metallo-hydrolase n=1 Tax=Bradyrhizobium ottawaense TaxID=931866 RepID=UPI003FA05372
MSLAIRTGDLTIHRIVKSEGPGGSALDTLPSLTPELLAENRSWMRQQKLLDENDQLITCIQCYVVKTPHHTIMIDTGVGNNKSRPGWPSWHMKTDDIFEKALNAAGFTFDQIDIVMCTHLHSDHVGWNTRLENDRWVPSFPNARYIFLRTEFDYWNELNKRSSVPEFVDSVLPIVDAGRAEIVGNEYQVADHIRILPTPGHTPGHVAFAFGRNKVHAVFWGDLMYSPLQALYPELSAKYDVDPSQAAIARRAFLERYCDTNTLCCTGHFISPSVVKIRRKGSGFACDFLQAR